jgi:2-dehydropantoate 2-reductase
MANPESRAFVRQLLDEACAVAQAAGARVDPALPDRAMAGFAALPPDIKASMAEDVLRGRKLEISWMSGRIHGLGRMHGIPTPAHTAAYRCLLLHANGAAGA